MKQLLILSVIFFPVFVWGQVFVNPKANGANTGTSWSDAFTDFRAALAQVPENGEIWIISDTIKMPGADPAAYYHVTKNMTIYGGFTGHETLSGQRDEMQRTVFTARLSNGSGDRLYAFSQFVIDPVNKVVLDGLKIVDGKSWNDHRSGAIVAFCNELIVNNCDVSDNLNGLYVQSFTPGRLHVENVHFDNNGFLEIGASINIKTPGSFVSVINSRFTGHINVGSIIKADTSNMLLKNLSFSDNQAIYKGFIWMHSDWSTKLRIEKTRFENNVPNNYYANTFISHSNGNTYIDHCVFDNNGIGGGGGMYLTGDSILFANSVFQNNFSLQPKELGRAFCIKGEANEFIIENVQLLKNRVDQSSIFNFEGKNALIKNVLIDSVVGRGDIPTFLMFLSHNFEMKNSAVSNSYGSFVSAVRLDGSAFFPMKKIIVDSCLFESLSSSFAPGVFGVHAGADTFLMANSHFLNNSTVSSNGGGGIYLYKSGYSEIKKVLFQNNQNVSFNQGGGAVYATGLGKLVVDSCSFLHNQSLSMGGAMTLQGGEFVVTHCLFKENRAGNYSGHGGGALYVSGAERLLLIDKNHFLSNSSAGGGGAIRSMHRGLISRNIFENNGNEQNREGGAFSGYNGFILYGNIFVGNQARNGGAVHHGGSQRQDNPLIINNTFIGNNSSGNRAGALLSAGGYLSVRNNIFFANGDSAVTDIGGPNTFTILDQNFIKGSGFAGIADYRGEPLLGEYHRPMAQSPVIDLSHDHPLHDQFETDLYGNPRKQGNGVDLGAVESEYMQKVFEVRGHVVYNSRSECEHGADTTGIDLIRMRATGDYHATTRPDGSYYFRLPQGDYDVQAMMPAASSSLTPLCPEDGIIRGLRSSDGLELGNVDFFNGVPLCRAIDVQVRSVAHVRGGLGSFDVVLKNKSAYPVKDRHLIIDIPSGLEILSSTPEYLTNEEYRIRYYVDSIPAGGEYRIQIADSVSNTISQEKEQFCIEAWLEGAETCLDPEEDRTWHDVSVSITCESEYVVFRLVNQSGRDMETEKQYRIYRNDTLVYESTYLLATGGVYERLMAVTTGQYRLEAEQIATSFTQSNAIVEGSVCGNGQDGYNVVENYRNRQLTTPWDVVCFRLQESYMGNSLAVSPAGIGPEGKVLRNQNLNYTIYFQNTGSETVRSLRIVDTLDIALVNAPIQLQASHNYTFRSLSTSPYVVEWLFEDLNLPDSISDPYASQGYLTFYTSIKSSVKAGTQISKKVYLYFDDSDALVTNEVINTVVDSIPFLWDEGPVTGSSWNSMTESGTIVQVSPNPFEDYLKVTVKDNAENDLLVIKDLMGRTVYSANMRENDAVLYPDLNAGIYLWELVRNGERIGSGKLIKRY